MKSKIEKWQLTFEISSLNIAVKINKQKSSTNDTPVSFVLDFYYGIAKKAT